MTGVSPAACYIDVTYSLSPITGRHALRCRHRTRPMHCGRIVHMHTHHAPSHNHRRHTLANVSIGRRSASPTNGANFEHLCAGHHWVFVRAFAAGAYCNVCSMAVFHGVQCDYCGVVAEQGCMRNADRCARGCADTCSTRNQNWDS